MNHLILGHSGLDGEKYGGGVCVDKNVGDSLDWLFFSCEVHKLPYVLEA